MLDEYHGGFYGGYQPAGKNPEPGRHANQLNGMSISVCLFANAIGFPEGGGLIWEYLNWALGFRALGCQVIWLEALDSGLPLQAGQAAIAALKSRLERYGLSDSIAICSRTGDEIPSYDMAG